MTIFPGVPMFSTSSRKEPLRISGTGYLLGGCPSCNPDMSKLSHPLSTT